MTRPPGPASAATVAATRAIQIRQRLPRIAGRLGLRFVRVTVSICGSLSSRPVAGRVAGEQAAIANRRPRVVFDRRPGGAAGPRRRPDRPRSGRGGGPPPSAPPGRARPATGGSRRRRPAARRPDRAGPAASTAAPGPASRHRSGPSPASSSGGKVRLAWCKARMVRPGAPIRIADHRPRTGRDQRASRYRAGVVPRVPAEHGDEGARAVIAELERHGGDAMAAAEQVEHRQQPGPALPEPRPTGRSRRRSSAPACARLAAARACPFGQRATAPRRRQQRRFQAPGAAVARHRQQQWGGRSGRHLVQHHRHDPALPGRRAAGPAARWRRAAPARAAAARRAGSGIRRATRRPPQAGPECPAVQSALAAGVVHQSRGGIHRAQPVGTHQRPWAVPITALPARARRSGRRDGVRRGFEGAVDPHLQPDHLVRQAVDRRRLGRARAHADDRFAIGHGPASCDCGAALQ